MCSDKFLIKLDFDFVRSLAASAEFFADNIHVTRSINSEPNSVRADSHNGDLDLVPDQNLFAWLP